MRLLLLRPADGLSKMASQLRQAGHHIVELALSRIVALETPLVQPLSAYDWVFFTSRQGLKHFSATLQQQQLLWPKGLKLAVVGEATKTYAEAQGYSVTFCPQAGEGAEQAATEFLALYAKSSSNKNILWPCSALAENTLKQSLEAQGWHVTRWSLYKSQPYNRLNQEQKNQIEQPYDALLFTSPSSVKAWMNAVQEEQRFKVPVWLSLGSSTTASIRALAPKQTVWQADFPKISSVLELLEKV